MRKYALILILLGVILSIGADLVNYGFTVHTIWSKTSPGVLIYIAIGVIIALAMPKRISSLPQSAMTIFFNNNSETSKREYGLWIDWAIATIALALLMAWIGVIGVLVILANGAGLICMIIGVYDLTRSFFRKEEELDADIKTPDKL